MIILAALIALTAIHARAADGPPVVDAVTNVASQYHGLIAPGAVISIYGANLSNGPASASSVPLPTTLAGTRVELDGVALRLQFVSPTQINAYAPPVLTAGTRVTLSVRVDQQSSTPKSLLVLTSAPGLLVSSGSHASAVNQDFGINSETTPGQPGSIVQIYMSGGGNTTPVRTEQPSSDAARFVLPVSAKLNGQDVEVLYAGVTPGTFLDQVNIRIPSNAPSGELPLVVTVGNASTQGATVSVRGGTANPVQLNPASLLFNTELDGPVPAQKVLTIAGSGSIAATAENASWLLLNRASPTSFNVGVNLSGLSTGVNAGSIRVTAGGSTYSVPVTLVVASVASACRYTLSTTARSTSPIAGTDSFAVQTTTGCAWTATSNSDWITISSGRSGTGNGTVNYSYTGNPGPDRCGTIAVTGGNTFTLCQTGNRTVVEPTTLTFNHQAGAPNPLPQSLNLSSFDFGGTVTATATTVTGGLWLAVAPASVSMPPSPAIFSVSVNPAGLAAGTYSGSIQISGLGNPKTVPVTLTVTGSNPRTLTSSCASAQLTSAAPTLSCSLNSTGGPIDFTIAVSGDSWLTAAPGAGRTPSTFTLTATPRNLAAGTYTNSVLVTAAGATNSPLSIPVSLTVVAAAPLTVSPAQTMFFRHQTDGTPPPAQTLAVTSSSPLAFTATAVTNGNGPWLTVTPRQASTNATLSIRVNPAGLRAATYDGVIRVEPAQGSALSIPVQLIVAASQPSVLIPEPARFSFVAAGTAVAGPGTCPNCLGNGVVLPSQLRVTNPGSNLLNFDVSVRTDQGNWLSATPGSGGANADNPAVLIVQTDPTGLRAGVYSGAISVTRPGGSVEVPVTLTVTGTNATLVTSQSALSFRVTRNFPPQEQSIDLVALGRGDVRFAASVARGETWLSIARGESGQIAAGGRQTASLTLRVNGQSLSPGEYHGQIRIDSADTSNSPQVVNVVLTVLPDSQDPGPSISPTGLTFIATAGGGNPAPRDVTLLYGSASSADGFTAGTTLEFGTPPGTPNWLQLPSSSGAFSASTRTATLTVQPLVTNLAPGVYRGIVTVNFPGNIGRTIAVLLVITAAAPKAERAAGCVPSSYLPLFTSLEQNFAVSSGAGSSTELVMVDDCGNPVTEASVGSSFSNQDRPFDLTPVGDGRWTATWVPRQSAESGAVTLNVYAVDTAQQVAAAKSQPLNGFLREPILGPVMRSDNPIVDPNGDPQYAVAPGSRVTIRGQRLAAANTTTTVRLGDTALQVISASPEAIVAVVPSDAPINTSLPLVIQRGEALSAPEMVAIAASWPIIVGASSDGSILATGLGDPYKERDWHPLDGEVLSVEAEAPGLYRIRMTGNRRARLVRHH